jgi:hypothetical protein
MKLAIAITVLITFCEIATAASTRYDVHRIAIGTYLSFDGELYREYKCSPSNQFDGVTRCQMTKNDRERRGSYTAVYSILHSPDGKVLYVNRSQEPAFFGLGEAKDDIRQYSRKIGESPRVMRMPHGIGVVDATIAVWGKITLEQLDRDDIKAVAEGQNATNELLIDFLGNVVRSAKEGLPVYRIERGSGFLWSASFDEKGRGTLRLTAIDASGLLFPPPERQRPQHLTEADTESKKLETELAAGNKTIAELKKAKIDAEAAHIEAAKARIDAEISRREIEQYIAAQKAKLDGTLVRRHNIVENIRWENALYGSIGGLLITLAGFAIGFLVNRRKERVWKRQVCELGATPVNASTKSQNSEVEIGSHAVSPETAFSKTAFGRGLEKQVAVINAARYGAAGQWRLLSRNPHSQLIWKSR